MLARACFALAILGSLVVLFSPGSDVPPAPYGVDKLVHASTFAMLAFTGSWAGVQRRWLLAALLLYAPASELIQTFSPLQRDGSVWDALADGVGILVGVVVWAAVARADRARR